MMASWMQETAIYLWMFDFFAWSMFCLISIRDKRISSSLITLTVVLVLDGVMTNFGRFMENFYDPGHTQLMRVVYYGGFALFDVLAIWIIHKAHKLIRLDYRFLAKTYLLAYFVMALIQIIRLAERLYFDGNTLNDLYKVSIGSINMCTAAIGVLIALIAVYMHFSHKHIGGKIWKV